MPEIIHCRVKNCGKAIRAKSFEDGMSKLRRHRKSAHPNLFRKSIKKGVVARKAKRGDR